MKGSFWRGNSKKQPFTMDVEKTVKMSNEEVLTKVSQFLTEEWAKLKPEDIEVTRLK